VIRSLCRRCLTGFYRTSGLAPRRSLSRLARPGHRSSRLGLPTALYPPARGGVKRRRWQYPSTDDHTPWEGFRYYTIFSWQDRFLRPRRFTSRATAPLCAPRAAQCGPQPDQDRYVASSGAPCPFLPSHPRSSPLVCPLGDMARHYTQGGPQPTVPKSYWPLADCIRHRVYLRRTGWRSPCALQRSR
jgi:hypothetical protein